MYKRPILYLLLGILFLIAGLLMQRIGGAYFSSQEYIVKLVEKNLEQAITDLEYEMIPVLDSVSTIDIIRFSNFNLEHEYPYFIFRNSELKIWSDYHYVPQYQQITGDFSLKILETENSLFIIRKWFLNSDGGQFEVVSLIPISIDYNVHNSYLSKSINTKVFGNQGINLSFAEFENALPISIRGNNLLWIADDTTFSLVYSPYNIGIFLFYITSIMMIGTGGYLLANKIASRKRKWVLLLAILIFWILLKVAMNTDISGLLINLEIFDSQFFAVSWFERSFADMLLNTVMIFLLSIVGFRHYRSFEPKYALGFINRLLIAVGIVFLLNLLINYQYLELRTIYFNSQISFDITRSLIFDNFRVFSLLVFVLISISTALLFHIFFKRLEVLTTNNKERITSLLVGSLIFWLFTYGVNLPVANLVIVTSLILLTLFYTKIHKSLRQLSNSITLYILFWIIIESIIAGWSISEFEQTRETNRMVRYAQNLASKNDYLAEFMIEDVMNSIKSDPSISARLSNPFLSKEFILNKITNAFLNKYLDKYHSSVYLYSHSGEGIPGFGTTLNFFDLRKRYVLAEHKTEFPNLYLLTQDLKGPSKHYMAFIPIDRYDYNIGYIMIDFRQKRLAPKNVYPELLVDNRFVAYRASEFSYAIFEGDYLIQSSGKINYEFFNKNKKREENPWIENGYKHYLLTNNQGDTILVSHKIQYLQQVVSNSTFLMVILLCLIIILLGYLLLFQLYRGLQVSYITKIQLFLNLAFFIPLTVVTLTTLSFITASFRQEQIDGKLIESERLASQIEKETDGYLIDISTKEILTEKLIQLANYGHFDATVYGIDGLMITTTQPGIFSSGLQSFHLNPQVLVKLVERHELNVVEDEQIGELNYYTTYAVVKSPETNRILGVLAIPFFKAKRTIEHNHIEALTTIMNVFILIFIIALIATFQTSRWLTTPLLMIRQKLGQTSFSVENKPILYSSDDEIGRLIAEYNNMIVKLEASKEALSRSQKESAWREVAQVVAHEIKNPITPMKLTLQKLEQAVKQSEGSDKLAASVENLLNQLQILNDIVTSFSEFAKMPIPNNEKMSITRVLMELKEHFASDENIQLKLQLPTEEVFISADRKLMSRILSNIILNAGQSKKDDQTIVDVNIATEYIDNGDIIKIVIEDNGGGMDKDVVERVFIPRFSTKKEGSGIGLAVAKHGIENAGGSIWFETELGRGTTFYLQLPQIV